MESSLLAKLPPELRNHVYELALQHITPISTTWLRTRDRLPSSTLPTSSTSASLFALTQTCMYIRAESLQPFYATNSVRICFYEHDNNQYRRGLYSLVRKISATNAAVLKSIVIDIGCIRSLNFGRIEHVVEALRALPAQLAALPLVVTAKVMHGTEHTVVDLDMQYFEASRDAVLQELGEREGVVDS